MKSRIWTQCCLLGLMLSACGSRSSLLDDESRVDAFTRLDGQVLDLVQDPCGCATGEAWMNGACVPTASMGCGRVCDPDDPSLGCPPGMRCDPSAAVLCHAASPRIPACAPDVAPTPLRGGLRIQPVAGPAGEMAKIVVNGHNFFLGALFYTIRIKNEEMRVVDMGDCKLTASFTPPSPGVYAVEVSQYAGGGPWILAGFYTASGGMLSPAIQPDFPCEAN
ncbi:MAG: hypothetical protein JRH20_10230, partial [Deltaproteobacteria bacterium]|nr:hypothetical protein [Deltaproteobacteria bacterium]